MLELRSRSPAPAEKVQRYRLAVDMVACRICVLDRQTDAPVALYLTSPGSAEHPTHGDHFTIRATFVMSAWNPPPSPWAAHLKPVAGGVDNPMGLCKLDLGAHTQYIHGIPKEEEPELGSAASHGCLRMSGANILEMHELYAGAGTDVTLIRDPTQCTALLARFRSAGIAERSIEEGRCYASLPTSIPRSASTNTLGPTEPSRLAVADSQDHRQTAERRRCLALGYAVLAVIAPAEKRKWLG